MTETERQYIKDAETARYWLEAAERAESPEETSSRALVGIGFALLSLSDRLGRLLGYGHLTTSSLLEHIDDPLAHEPEP